MVEGSHYRSAIGELHHLKTLLQEITTSLSNQREILKVRGIQLPVTTTQTLTAVTTDLEKLETTLVSEQTELGQLRSLADNAASITASFNLDEVLSNAIDVITSLTGAERGYIILTNGENDELDFKIIRENEVVTAPRRTADTPAPEISYTVVREVLDTAQPLLTDNAYKDERLQGNASVFRLTLRSVLCVPLQYKNEVLGVVYVDNRLKTGVFDQRAKNLLAAFGNQVSVAIENARLFTRIQNALAEITAVKELTDNVFESIGSGIITTDSQDKITTFNRAASHILESDRNRVIGEALTNVLSGLITDLSDYLQNVRTGSREVLDTELEISQRGRIALNMKLSPLKDTQGVAVVLDDMTEQRERAELLSIMKRYLPPEMVDNIHSIAGLDLGGERREITCLFADVRSISTFPEGMRPQQIMEAVNIYLTTATDCIHQVKGVIDKYMGTEVMGLFNSQLNPQEDHAYQAVEAALLIREACIQLYQQLGLDPNTHYYRIGIHTGVATLGNVGSISRRDFTAIGDTINLAKRLEENATAGQVIISEETRRHLESHWKSGALPYRFEEREAIQVKGRQQQTRIYEVFRR